MENLKRGFGTTLLRVLSIIGMVMPLAACNGNSQTAATSAVTTTGYYTANGVCYQSGTTTVVATTYCGTTTTTSYYLVGGICYSSATGAVMTPAASYCGTTGTGTVGTGNICYGTYFDPQVGQWGQCNGTNCHGVYLYTPAGALVFCP